MKFSFQSYTNAQNFMYDVEDQFPVSTDEAWGIVEVIDGEDWRDEIKDIATRYGGEKSS